MNPSTNHPPLPVRNYDSNERHHAFFLKRAIPGCEARGQTVLTASRAGASGPQDGLADLRAVAPRHIIGECEAKMARYQAVIDAGGDIQEIIRWKVCSGPVPTLSMKAASAVGPSVLSMR